VDMDFMVRSLDDLNTLIHDKIGPIDGILKAETSIITSYEKEVFDYGTALSSEP
jgi:hypothetical protein